MTKKDAFLIHCVRVVGLFALFGVVFAGCGARNTPQNFGDSTPTHIDVVLTEYSITVSDSLKAGPTVLHVMNHGVEDHNFAINGNGLRRSFLRTLHADEERDMNVVLSPGSYEMYCPLEHHADKGMRIVIIAPKQSSEQ